MEIDIKENVNQTVWRCIIYNNKKNESCGKEFSLTDLKLGHMQCTSCGTAYFIDKPFLDACKKLLQQPHA